MSEFLASNRRSHSCGALRASDAGTHAVLTGWVQTYRDHGGCVFIDLRDREGVTQLVFDPSFAPVAHELARDLRNEWCIGVRGEVRSRGGNVNDRMPTGAVEVWVSQLEVFSRADTPPFAIEDEVETNEALRLKYRYLDLRRPKLQRNLIMRSAITRTTRDYLGKNGFLEIETPFMVKYTPGGARNFLVPSRLNPGAFYALAESPQIFKQLLMVAGYERYFQIVRCFRDEDLRLDRQPEFTQIDLELSFVNEEILQGVMEGLIAALWKEVLGIELTLPLRRMTYAEAMDKYGVDKPDLRLDLVLCDVTAPCGKSGFRVFEGVVAGGGIVKCLRIPDGDKLSRSQLDGLTDFAKQFGVKGVAFARVLEGGTWQAPFAKSFSDEARIEANRIAGAGPGDVLIFVAEKAKIANTMRWAPSASQLRDSLGLVQGRQGAVAVPVGHRLPAVREDDKGYGRLLAPPVHLAARRPQALLDSDPAQVLAQAYDLVLNGNEVGGGSIRIHRSDVQAKHLRDRSASRRGADPAASSASCSRRFATARRRTAASPSASTASMLMAGATESLRDVIAFPKTQRGTDLMTECPTGVSKKQLDELFIQLRPDLPQ
jgi:aspartyl-tRNA synthetase